MNFRISPVDTGTWKWCLEVEYERSEYSYEAKGCVKISTWRHVGYFHYKWTAKRAAKHLASKPVEFAIG